MLCLCAIFYFSALFLLAEGTENGTKADVSIVKSKEDKTVDTNKLDSSVEKSPIGKSIKEDNKNSHKRGEQSVESKKEDTKMKDNKKKENELHSIVAQHQINNFDKELRYKGDQEEKKKGKLQTVGGVFGDIIGVIISEVVRIFGNLVSDVAREVTAHGFVSIFKQFSDFTGISLAGNNMI
jgi:hypothetical protein